MIFHEYCLLAYNSHEISCMICYFCKSNKISNCRLLQIIGGALFDRDRTICFTLVYVQFPVHVTKNSKHS